MPNKHFLNSDYKDLKDPGSERYGLNTVLGLRKQVAVKLSKGSTGKPDLVVAAEADPCDDAPFLPDAVVHDIGESDEGEIRFFEVHLPDVTGVTWRIYAKLGSAPRREVGSFVTWRRIHLSASFPDAAARKLYEKALPMVSKAFEECFIEVAENGVTVEGKAIKKTRNHPRTCIYVDFSHPSWENYKQRFALRLKGDGLAGSDAWTRAGNLLKLKLDSDRFRFRKPRSMDGPGPLQGFEAAWGGRTRIKLPSEAGFFPPDELDQFRAIARFYEGDSPAATPEEIGKCGEAAVDLDADPLKEAKKALEDGETVDLTLSFDMEQLGRSAGGAVKGNLHFDLTVFPGSTPEKLAGVMTHEIAHIYGLVKDAENGRNGARFEFKNYHTNNYGGQGNHCSHNAVLVENGATASGFIYAHDREAGALCTMHFKSDPLVDKGRFCPNCRGQIRRADMSAK